MGKKVSKKLVVDDMSDLVGSAKVVEKKVAPKAAPVVHSSSSAVPSPPLTQAELDEIIRKEHQGL
jgi:hypothetical protein